MDQPTQDSLVLRCNKLAMERLKHENYSEALTLLRQAEFLLNQSDPSSAPPQNRLKLLAITLNNLGCYYKRKKQPNVALRYLIQAMEIEGTHEQDFINLAGTQLNVCAIYSQLGKHSEALKHAYDAFKLLESAKERNEGAFQGDAATRVNAATTLVIAYHNVAVELEFLKRESDAVEFYRKGAEVAMAELGQGHSLARSIANNEESARKRVEELQTKASARQQYREEARLNTSRRARSRAPDVSSRLPPVHPRDHSYTSNKGQREMEANISFPPYRLSTAPEPFTQEHRLVIEDGIAGTRRFISPRARLQAYLH